ncbi:MAG TPA: class I SAM-dependent methyltransferase [Patescibacteria group bacterium]|nr:class I SAM-dependent methyltransferase [Patescibacteria group bacterium]
MNETDKNLLASYQALADFKHDFRDNHLFAIIRKYVRGRNILDIGCGSGFFLSSLAATDLSLFGLEKNPDLVALARKANPGMPIFDSVAENLHTVVDKKMDTITMLDVLEHLQDDDLIIKQVYNQLLEAGRLIIVVPAYRFLYGKRDRTLGHYRRYLKKDLVNLLKKNGFKIHLIRHWNMLGFLPYLVLEKVFKQSFNLRLRFGQKQKFIQRRLWQLINFWLSQVENNLDFKFGLSLICVADKINNQDDK